MIKYAKILSVQHTCESVLLCHEIILLVWIKIYVFFCLIANISCSQRYIFVPMKKSVWLDILCFDVLPGCCWKSFFTFILWKGKPCKSYLNAATLSEKLKINSCCNFSWRNKPTNHEFSICETFQCAMQQKSFNELKSLKGL